MWRSSAVAVVVAALVMLRLGRPGVAAAIVIAGPVLYVLLIVLTVVKFGDYRDERVWWVHRGRYVVPSQLDGLTRGLLDRAQSAIDVVLGSHINSAGLLDSVHNKVALPAVEWEIAKTLQGLSRLRAEHPELTGMGAQRPGGRPPGPEGHGHGSG